MIGNLYLTVKKSWRPWLVMAQLDLKENALLKSIQTKKRASNLIISLTTFELRVKALDHTLKSIVNGSVLPEGIYLYVDQNTADLINKMNKFSQKLIKAKMLHLRVVENVRSYKKLVFALSEHPDKDIVIADDDVLYPSDWLEDLYTARANWKNNNKVIICHRGHRPLTNSDGSFQPYKNWPKSTDHAKEPVLDLFPTGTGGVLYPAGSMPPITRMKDLYQKYAPTNDDIWFWFSALSNKCSFVLTGKAFHSKRFLEIPEAQRSSLYSINVNRNANDVQIKETHEYFKSLKATTAE